VWHLEGQGRAKEEEGERPCWLARVCVGKRASGNGLVPVDLLQPVEGSVLRAGERLPRLLGQSKLSEQEHLAKARGH